VLEAKAANAQATGAMGLYICYILDGLRNMLGLRRNSPFGQKSFKEGLTESLIANRNYSQQRHNASTRKKNQGV
jgi:hypothetical protein